MHQGVIQGRGKVDAVAARRVEDAADTLIVGAGEDDALYSVSECAIMVSMGTNFILPGSSEQPRLG